MGKETLGEMLRRLRIEKEIGVRELGRLVDVTGVHISSIEKDKATPSSELLSKIAKVLEVDVDRLLLKAKKVDPELIKVIQRNPYAIPDFLRTAKNLTKGQWEELKKKAEEMQAK